MFNNICFESQVLITEKLEEKDALSLFNIYSDSEAMKYRGSKPMKNKDDAYGMIAEQFITNNQISKLRLGIWNKSEPKLIGTLVLVWNNIIKDEYEIGFSFGKDYWGKGYGKETLDMVVRHFFFYENSTTIKAWCIKENYASCRIFENAGFSNSKIKQSEFPNSNLFIKKINQDQIKSW